MKHIYLIQNKLSEKAEKICNDEAKKMGFEDWWNWHESDKNMGVSILKTKSYKYCEYVEKLLNNG